LKAAGFTTLHQVIGSGADAFVPSSANEASPWARLKVRQAAQYAMNLPEYVTALFGDEAEPANQLVGKNSWAYNPSVVGYPYNPDKAKQLLTEAGYPDGFSSVIFGYTDQTMNKRALAIQSYLGKVGIKLDVQIVQNAQMTQMSQQGGGWEGLLACSLGTSTDVIDTLSRYYSGTNAMMFKSMAVPADYAKAIQDAISAPDFATKQKLAQELMKTFTDTYCLHLLQDTRFDNAFEQKYVINSGILKGVNTQMWTPEAVWINK
jgi:peptide/nickel transport system substrate-binding protein